MLTVKLEHKEKLFWKCKKDPVTAIHLTISNFLITSELQIFAQNEIHLTPAHFTQKEDKNTLKI